MQVGDLVKQTGFAGVGIIVKMSEHGIGVQWSKQFCFVPVHHLEIINASR